MAISVLNSNPRVKWRRLASDLGARFSRPDKGLLSVIDVWQSYSEARDLLMTNPNYLLVGRAAQELFVRRLPREYRMKELDYGSSLPILYIIDAASGYSKFFCALYYPEPQSFDGRNLFNGCCFLLENQTIRDRLFVHQIRRYFAPHEASIFGVDPGSLPAPAAGLGRRAVRPLASGQPQGMATVPGPQENDLPF